MSGGPVLLITGASSGIGAATARAAAGAGYRVVLGARREAALRRLSEELGGIERALPVRADVTEWEDQERLVSSAPRRDGCSWRGVRYLKHAPPH